MALVWITSAVLLLVVVPVVVTLLNGVKAPVEDIRKQSEYLLVAGGSLVTLLDATSKLPRTRELVGQTGAGLARYGGAVDQILG
jgi:hypothetical protein